MKIVFRVDSSVAMGAGHVMRCLALADEMKARGAETIFITRLHKGNLAGLIRDKGHVVYTLPAAVVASDANETNEEYTAWLGVPWEQDARETIATIGDSKPDWLVVDHYALDHNWESMLRRNAERILVVDDLENRLHECDLLLDQNYNDNQEQRYERLSPVACEKLLGPRFALLRKEFLQCRKSARKHESGIIKLLVFFGGADPKNVTKKAINAICKLNRDDITVSVVVGNSNPNKAEIEELCKANQKFQFYAQVDNMAELMSTVDLAIGAGGINTWERCCLGLPSIVITNAENQIGMTQCLAEGGFLLCLGDSEHVNDNKLCSAISLLIDNPQLRKHFSSCSYRLVDGKGVQRVIEKMYYRKIKVRRATESDRETMYLWRNDIKTRRFFNNPSPVTIEEHCAWFSEKLKNPSCALLIGEADSRPVGVLRYDISGDCATVSVYLDPEKQGLGFGASLIVAGNHWAREYLKQVRQIRAEILPDNAASINAFKKAGFIPMSTTYSYMLE